MLDSLLRLDGQLLLAVQNLHQPWLDPVVSLFTKLGDAGILFIALSLAMLLYKPTRKVGLVALAAMVLGLLVTNITIKPLVERARPWTVLPLTPLVTEKDPNSFPSGHTNAAFAFALAVCRSAPKKWMKITAICMAVVMGLSRLYVGVHFPSDVLVGAAVGSLCGLAGAWVIRNAAEYLKRRRPIQE